MTIKGQPGTVLEITEGPIIIKINDSSNKGTVKFSELNIIFNGMNMQKKQINSYLFKLFPGTIVEIEDCDIEAKAINHEQKLLCIQINSQKGKKRNESINNNISSNQNLNIGNIGGDPNIPSLNQNSNQNLPYISLNQIGT